MTPPYHRPYLTETDLRTPEDVLAWLRRPILSRIAEEYPDPDTRSWYVGDAEMLWHRLDRERRQACRRAALRAWRDFANDLRAKALHDAWACQWCHRQIALALAFRSAAREP